MDFSCLRDFVASLSFVDDAGERAAAHCLNTLLADLTEQRAPSIRDTNTLFTEPHTAGCRNNIGTNPIELAGAPESRESARR